MAGWEVECNATGLPFAWTPLTAADLHGQREGTAQIVSADAALLRATRCKSLARATSSSGNYTPGTDLTTMFQQVFGLR